MSFGPDLRCTLVILAGLFVAGCGDQPGTGSYVGVVEGSDAVVGAVAADGQISFYLCGGKDTYATDTRWFSGPVDPSGAISIVSKGWTLTGALADGGGTIATADGRTLTWTARPASGEMEGLYAAKTGACRTGAVVTESAAGPDLQGVWCTQDQSTGEDIFAQVTPLMPMELAVDRIQVRVMEPVADADIFVAQVKLP